MSVYLGGEHDCECRWWWGRVCRYVCVDGEVSLGYDVS